MSKVLIIRVAAVVLMLAAAFLLLRPPSRLPQFVFFNPIAAFLTARASFAAFVAFIIYVVYRNGVSVGLRDLPSYTPSFDRDLNRLVVVGGFLAFAIALSLLRDFPALRPYVLLTNPRELLNPWWLLGGALLCWGIGSTYLAGKSWGQHQQTKPSPLIR